MNHETIQAINGWSQQIESLVSKNAPGVWQIAVSVERTDAIGGLITAIVCLAILTAVAVRSLKICAHTIDDGKGDSAKALGSGALGTIAVLINLGVFILIICNQWTWIAAFNPNLALAHDIMQKALAHP